jgi:proteasome lid subunit RPN8/RPN11
MKKSSINIAANLAGQTLEILRQAGNTGVEGVTLWLARRTNGEITVAHVYTPEHEADSDYFHIPPHAMSALLRHLGDTNTFIAAQVHSHPYDAYHSRADDKWAIVRHEGALSLVVPDFAEHTFDHNFNDEVAAFRLDHNNVWRELDEAERRAAILILE